MTNTPTDRDAQILLRDQIVIGDEGDHWVAEIGHTVLHQGTERECEQWVDRLCEALAPRIRTWLAGDWRERLAEIYDHMEQHRQEQNV